jgi:hypothetical protein
MRRLVWLVLAACGDHAMPPPSPDAATGGCTAQLSGNFAETSSSPANCPTLAMSTLDFTVAVMQLGSDLDISITLPAAMPGSFSSETVPSWSAMAFEPETNSGCVFRAGNDATPEGSFTLSLDAIAPPHGSLALSLSVLSLPGSTCGLDDVELAALSF